MGSRDPDPKTASPHPAASGAVASEAVASRPVTAGEIAALVHRLTRHRSPARGGDPTEHAALLAHKAELLARIAVQHAHTDPAHADQARQAAEHARATAARHAAMPDTQDRTDVNDLTSPSNPRWGISLSNTAEFRRAPSPRVHAAWSPH